MSAAGREDSARYVGRAAYLELDSGLHAKLQFVTQGIADRYGALQLSAISRTRGEIDRVTLRFEDVWGGQAPYLWRCDGKTEWYGAVPTPGDNLGNAASSTFNSFMTNAARFYLGYIKARETEDYLSKTLLSIISARQERSDKATVSVLYALAVELNILQRILVSHFDIPDEVYAELRRKARAEVAVSRKGAQIESVQAQMFGGDTGWQSSSQNGAI